MILYMYIALKAWAGADNPYGPKFWLEHYGYLLQV